MQWSKNFLASKRKKIQNQFVDFLELPQDALLDLPKITITGDKYLCLENHRGIIEYNSEKIRVSVLGSQLEISGKELILKNIKTDEIAVEGQIEGLLFLR
ncbi:sporulation protein YqfC [Bacillota bacterium LX-D]|nr:sporulation protein YqfC [Bacillota bacterium LX-D]